MLDACELCPRRCAADRTAGAGRGFCGAGDSVRLFRWGPHFGEEPPVTGERGSGCIFFSGCTMKCLYCQNSPWSWRGAGEEKTVAELADIMRGLAAGDRAENWNLVSPTPYLPFIREAAAALRAEGTALPFVWNSSGYERVETLEEYSSLCDCALFDLRYSRDDSAAAASAAPGYVAAARSAVKWAWTRKRVPSCPAAEALPRLIVRILVLPGMSDQAVENLEWIASELSREVPISVMSQYTPSYRALESPPFDRRITEDEYAAVAGASAELGFENGWLQGMEASDGGLSFQGENMQPGHGAVV